MTLSHTLIPPRDRYLAFAFAGSDMLVETTTTGIITFAAGAFHARLNAMPEYFIGRQIADMVAPADRGQLGVALSTITSRGRIIPMLLRLNDPERSQVNLSAMLVPGAQPRLCFTFGPPPLPASGQTDIPSPRAFAREIEARLQLTGGGGAVSLLEVVGWQDLRTALTAAEQGALRNEIQAAMAAASSGALTSELAEGRFGALLSNGADFTQMVARVEGLLRASPVGRQAKVEGAVLPLSGALANPSQAVRALRYTLSQFASGGTSAAQSAGASRGLDGIISQAEHRARALRGVIAERKFRLNYQPVVSLDNGAVHHFEALLRPNGNVGGLPQTTQDFILFTEAVGLTEELDCAVTDVALTAMRSATAASVAVNVSGLSIQSRRFLDRFLEQLAAEGDLAASGRLLVELTETAEIDDMAVSADNIAQLRDAGVPVCLDDFGVGAAAFAYLRDFKVDFVKIDGLYVQRALAGPREQSFITSMVELAGGTGARVVAEMIETEAQAELMRALGVQFGQGFLFGRPGLLPGIRR